MTNEEKAKSMWYNWCPSTTCQGIISCVNCPHAHAHPQLLEMAQWKDKQTVLFLEKIEREAVDTTTANYLKKAIEDFKNNQL